MAEKTVRIDNNPMMVTVSNPTTEVVVQEPVTVDGSVTATVTGTVTSNVGTGTRPVREAAPASSDVVGASRTTTGTLVTIPAGRVFKGSLSLSLSVAVAGNSQPTIATSGTGVLPLGTLHQIVANGLALSTVTNSNTIDNVYIYGGSAGATVTFTAGANGLSTGQITGVLL